jgi:dihydroorotase
MFSSGIRPHYYCLPVAKREDHRVALVDAATSGLNSFFLGTDSAPHFDFAKESACGCAGCFTATNSIPIITQIFDNQHSLKNLEAFVSINGANFYNVNKNNANIILEKGDTTDFPITISCQSGNITIFDPGFPVNWKVRKNT